VIPSTIRRIHRLLPLGVARRLKSCTALVLGSLLLACTIISCGPAKKGYESALLSSNEHELRMTLSSIRELIELYSARTGGPPRALGDLVEAGYINEIPKDPITKKADWIVVGDDCNTHANCKKGIKTIHSASNDHSTEGSVYSDW
jgi:general secretion pathway protein G